jgi:hypothetical protein
MLCAFKNCSAFFVASQLGIPYTVTVIAMF